MGDHTRPLHAFDPTMHIPLIFRHTGAIAAGGREPMLVANYDLMPTILGYLGLAACQPTQPPSPGRDFTKVLRGQNMQWENVIFYEHENTRAIRTDQWKLVIRHDDGPNELYHLAQDPGEWVNLYHDPAHDQQRAVLSQQLSQFFDRHADPKYDLWRDGTSQTVRLTKPQ
jgi:arylsulfatase A-like enzyme